MLTKAELNILNERLRTLQMKNGMGIPRGRRPEAPAAHQPSCYARPLILESKADLI